MILSKCINTRIFKENQQRALICIKATGCRTAVLPRIRTISTAKLYNGTAYNRTHVNNRPMLDPVNSSECTNVRFFKEHQQNKSATSEAASWRFTSLIKMYSHTYSLRARITNAENLGSRAVFCRRCISAEKVLLFVFNDNKS